MLVGNKIDLIDKRCVVKSDIDKITQEFSLNYHETSALSGEGVNEMIQDINRQIYMTKFAEPESAGQSTGATSAASLKPPSDGPVSDKDRPSFMLGQQSA